MIEEETIEIKYEEIKYEFEKLVAAMPMPDSFWRDAAIPAMEIAKMAHWNFVQAIITWEAARRRLIEYRWPAKWQDAFKERWFPEWAKRRWPVRWKRIMLDELAAIRRGPGEKPYRYFVQANYPLESINANGRE